MDYDLVIRGGTLIDGSGAPARRGDVAVRGDRIAALGDVDGEARETLDADGCWVTPGFVDPHTHLDAQLCWDPTGSPTNLHGVTTAVLGLCGFGVAPCPEGGEEYLLRSLERVEEIPFESTSRGVPFGWRSWADYAAFLGEQPLGLNVAGYVPHSALRCYAMGERARGEQADAADRERMVAELVRAFAAGALGFATSRGPNHEDAFGEPVPSRHADESELRALVGACRGRSWQINVETKFGDDAAPLLAEVERYAAWSREAGAALTWSPLHADPGTSLAAEILARTRELCRSGVRVVPQVAAQPITIALGFEEFTLLAVLEGWRTLMQGFYRLDHAARLERLADPAMRAQVRDAPEDRSARLAPHYDEWIFLHTPSRPEWVGRQLAAESATRGVHPVDLLCDQAIADDLATVVQAPMVNRDREGATRLLKDEHTLLALGDAGAHVTSVTNYSYPSYVLGELVREQSVLSPEWAIARMTSHPARFLGLAGRGQLETGMAADLNVIDPDAVGLGPVSFVTDLPAQARRLFQPGRGYRATLVAGRVVVADGEPTHARPGRLLGGGAVPAARRGR